LFAAGANNAMTMLGAAIHSIERRLWQQETRRRTHPFAWGLDCLGGGEGEARAFLQRYAEQALAQSDDFFASGPAEWYQLDGEPARPAGELLTFPSALQSLYPENNLVYGRVFRARGEAANGRRPKRAVVVLPQWNAQPESHVNICRVLAFFGITAVRLSLPYHDERKPAGLERADYMVSPNVGLTIQASRQAVLDARRTVRWLTQQGYERLGILGTSIGSAVAFITLAHEPALRAGVFLHVSTYFADVVRMGMTTSHVWAGLEGQVTADELRHYWAPISPYPYVPKLKGAGKKLLLVSGRYDLSFPFELTQQLWRALDEHEVAHEKLVLPCGHYTLGRLPFSYWAGLRFVPFLRRALS
ncbi:MAG: RcgR family putative quorum lactone hydrolase, partial [Candidatus Acidiferrales bacterium]